MRFSNTSIMDFEKVRAYVHNTDFGNEIITTSQMNYFNFELDNSGSFYDLQSQDFYLQSVNYLTSSQEFQFEDYLLLDDTYKQTGYFDEYDFASEIDAGLYRIRAGEYYSLELIKAIDIDISDTTNYNYLVDNSGNILIDNNDKLIIEPI